MSDIKDVTIDLLADCLEVLNQITNRSYWSHGEQKESITYTLASKVDKEISRLKESYGSGK